MKKIYLLLFFVLTSILYLQAQTTENRAAISDNSMYAENSNNSNGIGENIFSGQTAGTANRRALIKFNFPGIPLGGGYAVSSATLKLYCTLSAPAGGPAAMSLHTVTKAWGEGTSDAPGAEGTGTAATPGDATWLMANYNTISWTNPGGDYNATASAATVVTGSGLYYSWTSPQLIADVQNWMNLTTPNNGWILIGDEATASSAKRFASRENSDITIRPVLEITYTTIPVKLLSFTAKETIGGIQLNWATAQEYNNDFFAIEHSTDGLNFNTVGIVRGVGFSQSIINYSFLHNTTASVGSKHFYRLVQTDKDGKKTTSTTIYIEQYKQQPSVLLQPNIITDNKLTIKLNTSVNGNKFEIYNNIGTMVLQGKLTGSVVAINNLSNGFYYLKIIDKNGEITSERFLKQ